MSLSENYLSDVIGWIYFTCWSISFYPQIIENYLEKNTEGLSVDYLFLNLIAYSSYTVFTVTGSLYPETGTGNVTTQDILFSIHALLCTFMLILQFVTYSRTKRVLSETTKSIGFSFIVSFLIILLIEKYLRSINCGDLKVFNSLIFLGYIKIYLTLLKYVPQIIHNFHRKSTLGFSIHSVYLDVIGGIFSFLQMMLNVQFLHKEFNLTKLTIGLLSFSMSGVFIAQRIVYNHQ